MKLKSICIILALLPLSLFGQRHYKGIDAIEGSFGSRLSGQNFDPFASVYYSQYTGYKTFWKLGVNYFETEIKAAGIYPEHSSFFNAEFRFAYTLVNFGENLFINVEGGAWVGLEQFTAISKYDNPQKEPFIYFPDVKKNDFVCGPSLGFEFEFFLSKRIGLVFNISEYYSPMSEITNWHTVGSAGVKFLIY